VALAGGGRRNGSERCYYPDGRDACPRKGKRKTLFAGVTMGETKKNGWVNFPKWKERDKTKEIFGGKGLDRTLKESLG